MVIKNLSFWQRMLATNPASGAALIMRLALAVVVFPHGAQKLFGWFGGYGFAGTMTYFTSTVGLPWLLGLLVIVLETFGMLALAIGLVTRLVAAGLAGLFAGLMLLVHGQFGFFMNWFGNQAGEGLEFDLLGMGLALGLLYLGGGKASVDAMLYKAGA